MTLVSNRAREADKQSKGLECGGVPEIVAGCRLGSGLWRTYVCLVETRGTRIRHRNKSIVGFNIELFNLHISAVLIQIIAELRHCDGELIKTKQTNFSPRSLSQAKTLPGLILQVSTLFLSHLPPFVSRMTSR
jgi:hypothetical protein